MGELIFAAKITHVPSMFISLMEGKHKGCREAAIQGHKEIGRRILAAGTDTIVFLDTHWLINSGYHVNGTDHFKGLYTSNEFPHFIRDLEYDHIGNPALAEAIAATATRHGVLTRCHQIESLDIEYGTLVPMYFMGLGKKVKIVSVAAWCAFSSMQESRMVGEAIRTAIEASGEKVALLASGSLSHRIHDNHVVEEGGFTISDEFYRQVDLRALDLWQQGRFKEFTDMLPTYSATCHGEGWMHDTAMLLGALGWDQYQGKVEIVTDYFPSSGTGQVNAVFPLH